MKNKSKSLKKTTDKIKRNVKDEQEKNRIWWESLPMTYKDWDEKERLPKTKKEFLKLEVELLKGNPYLNEKFNFGEFKDKKVLEIGCGSGAASCLFAKNGAKVTAIDITEKAVEITKKNSGMQGLKMDVKKEDAEKMTFPKESFDYVFSWGVLHHSKNTLKAFAEVSRVLKKNGEGLIMVYNKNSLRYYINGINWLLLRGKIFQGYNLEKVQDFYTDGYYHRHFTPKELKKGLEKLNLKCKAIDVTHMGGYRMLPSLIPKGIEKSIKKNWGWLLVARFTKN